MKRQPAKGKASKRSGAPGSPTGAARHERDEPARPRRGVLVAGLLAALVAGAALFHALLMGSAAFRLDGDAGALRIVGVTPGYEDEAAAVFAEDMGRSILGVDIAARRRQLRLLPWVRDARVLRVWPASLRVEIEERVPIALLSLSDSRLVRMIDRDGMILEHRGGNTRGLPFITGIGDSMGLQERRERIDLYRRVMDAFETRNRASDVQAVNLADSSNAVVRVKHRGQTLDMQMGNVNLAHRLDVFLNYIDAWHFEYGRLESVDLRFERQVAVRPKDGPGGSG